MRKQNASQGEYLRDRDSRDIVERRVEKAIQASLDVASHIVVAEGYREPQDYGDLFRILEEEGVLSSGVADRMVEMAGFRNVLAHEYAGIDDERVYEQLHDLGHFETYAEEMLEFVDS